MPLGGSGNDADGSRRRAGRLDRKSKEGKTEGDSFGWMLAEKERELHRLTTERVTSLRNRVEEVSEENRKLKSSYEKLREDFRFNLNVIDERDAELQRYDKAFGNVKEVLSLRDAEIRTLRANVEEARRLANDSKKREVDNETSCQEKMNTICEELAKMKRELDNEKKLRRDADAKCEDFASLHRDALRKEDVAVSEVRKAMRAEQERRIETMKKRHKQEMALSKARESDMSKALDTLRRETDRELTDRDAACRGQIAKIKMRLKTRQWELDDERQMRKASDEERKTMVQAEEAQKIMMTREYNDHVRMLASRVREMEVQNERQHERLVAEEAELRLLRTSEDAEISAREIVRRENMTGMRHLAEETQAHLSRMEAKMRSDAETRERSIARLESQAIEKEETIELLRSTNAKEQQTLSDLVASQRREVEVWKQRASDVFRSNTTKRHRYEVDMAHKQEMLAAMENDLGDLTKRFASRTGSLRDECSTFAERAREAAALSEELREVRAELVAARETAYKKSSSLALVKSKVVELESSRVDALERARKDMTEHFERTVRKLREEHASEKSSWIASSRNVLTPQTKTVSTSTSKLSPPRPLQLDVVNISSPTAMPSPTFSEDMGPASPMMSMFSPARSPQRSEDVTTLSKELEDERRKNARYREQVDDMRKDMESTMSANEQLKSAVSEMRAEMEKTLANVGPDPVPPDVKEASHDRSEAERLESDLRVARDRLRFLEADREKLMEINKRRRWYQSNDATYAWAKEAWPPTHVGLSSEFVSGGDPDSEPDGSDGDDEPRQRATTNASASERSIEASMTALREIERCALRQCYGLAEDFGDLPIQCKTSVASGSREEKRETRRKNKKPKSLKVEHSDALLRAMGIDRPLTLRGKTAPSRSTRRVVKGVALTATARATESQLSRSEKMKRGSSTSLSVNGRSATTRNPSSDNGTRSLTRQRKVRNYNIRDDEKAE